MIVFDTFFGDFVKKARTEKKLTLEKVATESGLSRQQMSNIEKGVSSPRLFTVYVILVTLQESMTRYEKFYKEKMK